MVEIVGDCDPQFERVRAVFAENWELFDEVGASVAVTVDGQPVVDLWGGWFDAARTQRWDRDTIVMVASTTKGLTGLCGNMLIDRGLLDPLAPVMTYWPEFAQNGKEGVLVEHLFDHRAGLPNMPRGVEPGDWEGVVDALASMRPRWVPGTAHSYHPVTYGYLIGEVIRRVTGMSVGTFLRREVCEPLGADAWIGVPAEVEHRCAEVCGQAAGMDEPAEYLALLAEAGAAVDVWETTYLHVLAGPDPVLEWVRGTALRPIIDALPDEADRNAFLDDLRPRLREAYPTGSAGTIFPFRRIFVVAQVPGGPSALAG